MDRSQTGQSAAEGSQSQGKGLIILVEDDPRFRRIYSDLLSQRGYTVLAAADGEEGLRLIYANVPKLMVVDVMLPGIDGIELCQKARGILGNVVPIISLSSLDELEVVQACMEAGADGYIIKSTPVEEIVNRLDNWARSGRMMKANARQAQKRRESMMTRLQAAANEQDSEGNGRDLSSDTDPIVAEISAFVADAKGSAGDDFGQTLDEKLYLVGYVVGAVEYWSVFRSHMRSLMPRYLRAALRETEVLTPEEIEQMLGALDDLHDESTFLHAVERGKVEALTRKTRGSRIKPTGLAKFRLNEEQKAAMGSVGEKLAARA